MTPSQIQSFEAFWSIYPRRVGKGAARKAYEKALKITTPEAIMAGLRRQLPYYASKDQQFIPHPSTFLNQERWDDEPQVPQQKPRTLSDAARDLSDMFAGRDDWRLVN